MKENRSYEAKETITNTFLKTVSAYANYGDGVIQFGIADDGTITGIENPADACLNIENRINDSITPAPDYTLDIDDTTNVITLSVKEGPFKPYYYKSKAYKRNDTATIEVDHVELGRLVMEGGNFSYDELTADKQNLTFSTLEKKMKKQLQISSLSSDILKTIGIINSTGKYTNAGALLADQNNFSGIDCARFGETIDIIQDREIYEHKSILQQYDDALSLYKKYYQYDEIKGAVRETVELIPEKAFRETIANALVHRAWDVHSQIRVAMYNDHIDVFTPGGLPKGITENEYLNSQISVLRNPIIAGVFFRLHIIESFGTGIQRINAAYRNSDAKPGHYFSPNAIKVTLPVIQSIADLSNDENTVYKNLSHTGRSSSEISESAGFGKNKTLNILHTLIQKGYVTQTGNGRGTKYRVK